MKCTKGDDHNGHRPIFLNFIKSTKKVDKINLMSCNHINLNAIQLLQNGTISKDTLVEWVNVVWFTEIYTFDNEDGVAVWEGEFSEMIASLNSNTEYTPL